MDNFNDIKQVWLTANVTTLPKADEIVRTIKKYRLKHTIKSICLIFVTLALLFTMVWVVYDYKSNLLTTRLGEGFMLLALSIILVFNTNTLRKIPGQKINNRDFIRFLKQEQARLIHFRRKTQIIGFILASIGLLLYLFEGVYNQKVLIIILVYGLTIAWLLFNWFILRPWALRKKTLKLNETIQKIESLSTQISDN
jgi:hypothetical protein